MDACRIEILAADAMDRHLAAWADLSARCLEPSVFNEPAFALTAARLIPARRKPRFLLVWDGGTRLIGLWCFVDGRVGFPASSWMHEQATAAFPLLDRHDAARALAAMASELGARTSAILLHGMPAEGETAKLLLHGSIGRCIPMERRSRAVLRNAAPVPSSVTRGDKEVRRQARRLADRGPVTTTSARSPDDVAAAIDRFLLMEARGWKGRQGTALAQSHGLGDFTRTMARGLAVTGQCRVDCLAVGEDAVAAGVVLRSGTRAFYWKTAYDEALRRLSPGVQLALFVTAAQLAEPGIDLTDSCAVPNHAMIDRLWPDRMDVVDLLWGPIQVSPWRLAAAVWLEHGRRAARQTLKQVWLRLRRSGESRVS